MGRYPDKGSGGESQDFDQLSRRQDDFRSAFAAAPFPIVTGDTPSQVVSIFDNGLKPVASPQQFAAHPVVVSGTESESGTYSTTVDTARNMIVTVLGGVPAVGDLLLAFLIDGRWVAERRALGGGGVSMPGCPCASSPTVLTMTSSKPESNFGIFQNATLVYGPTPAALLPLGIGTNSHLSVESFVDITTGDTFRYYFSCYFGYYFIIRVYEVSIYGSPFRDLTRYRWPIGLSGNTCNPFSLLVGQIFSGGDPSCIVTVTGA